MIITSNYNLFSLLSKTWSSWYLELSCERTIRMTSTLIRVDLLKLIIIYIYRESCIIYFNQTIIENSIRENLCCSIC